MSTQSLVRVFFIVLLIPKNIRPVFVHGNLKFFYGKNVRYETEFQIAILKGGASMATIQPKGENIRQAVKWISAELIEDENRPISPLVQEASLKFNLSPKEEEYLISFYEQK